MIDPVNKFDGHVAARLLDFFDSRTGWQRKLWYVGTSLTLRELLEAIAAFRAGVLNEGALSFLGHAAQRMVGADPGAGSPEERRLLQEALKTKPRFEGLNFHLIEQHEDAIRRLYLGRWAAALRAPRGARPRPERTARAVASHLLDLGFSSDFLHRWWTYHLQHEATVRPLADIVDAAQQLSERPTASFETMVPVATTIPDGVVPPEWRPAPEVSHWLKANDFDVTGIRHNGGFLFTVNALDAEAAVVRVSEIVGQMTARLAVGTKGRLGTLGRVWVKGAKRAYPIDQARRGVWVEALEREHQLYNARTSTQIDAALELLSHLQASSPAAAVAGGWAAIEALLSEPGERAGAADRLAILVACSFPRAELTALSYALEKVDPAIGARLQPLTENVQRCEIVVDALVSQTANIAALRPSDRAAAARMLEILQNPHALLNVVQEHARIAFRRLYRQRNLVLHWGKTNAVALRASLRTTAPLVGAGMDRIVHAFYVDGAEPLQLVARASTALATVGTPVGPHCTAMLG